MPARVFSVLMLATAATSAVGQTVSLPAAEVIQRPPHPALSDASAAEPLTLDVVLGLAAQANPTLRSARADVDASAAAFSQAGARPNPELSFLQEGFGGAERTTTALINQTVEPGGKRRARMEVASYGREVALATLDSRAAALRAQVIVAFYELLAAQRQLRVAEEATAIAARSVELADRRARAGKVSPVEATKAKVAASSVQLDLVNAKTRVASAHERLANITASPSVRESHVAGDIETVPPIEPLSALVARLDDVPQSRAARAEMLRTNAAIAVERARRIPDVTFSAGMKRVVTGGVRDNQSVIGISIPLPLFDNNKGAFLEAVHKAEKASTDFDGEKTSLELEVTQAYRTISAPYSRRSS
ncbi:MAG: Cobalt/zinc/cadmium efflux RND transporter, outer membrane protein CzcC [uncultured Paraburkholderia sp.]|nr:MAG: Cobalt/zinc/cadmium efflux RND transporter, outer membrane protein CzcC [uncultured Paraburkholderia sp.]CAH2942912.1 MAG: Cobalt/zinc/cadmium efflux RND transporter, outer membrane protein CzcC [uncultured Paraburkholderia sp.]